MVRLLVLLCCLSPLAVSAKSAADSDYASKPAVTEFVDRLVSSHGFERDALLEVFAEAKKKQSILDAISRPAEKRLEWFEYRRIFLKKDRIEKGKKFMQTHRDTLLRAQAEFGVPAEIITAIIGVETRYGSNKGSYRVVDALSTLAFDYPPRSKFFTKELEQVFLLAKEQGFDVLDLKGSYAGAMGFGQFIPSSYRHYAIDFDGDGVADILNNVVDAIGSVANYFAQHKWKSGAELARKLDTNVTLPESFTFKSLKPKHTLAELVAAGVPMQPGLDGSISAKLQALGLEDGSTEQWLTLHNFYVITRYNHSHMYAMAVYQLSKEIGGF